jgi:site-specific recombinase XerD
MITENIHNLETKSNVAFMELGYTKLTINTRGYVTRALVRLHEEQGKSRLCSDIVADYVKHQETRYQKGEISKQGFFFYKTVTEHLTQISDSGTIINKCRSSLPALPDYFENILADILANNEWSLRFRKSQRAYTGTFFRWLYSNEYNDLSRVDEHIVCEYLTDCSERMTGSSLNAIRRALKNLFKFISEDGTLPESMNKLFLFKIPIDKKMQPFMTQDEVASILNVIDRSTVQGKRDYAMIILAAITGLRGVDIIGLSLDSIDWSVGEIRITQDKTDKALALPLTTDVGLAICDYILNARPCGKSDKVFLRTTAPFDAVSDKLPNAIMRCYCAMAGLTYKTFHSLRRGIATNMVASGVSALTVAQTLGHRDIDSTKQYISLDSKNLKECSLDFGGISIGGDLL